MNIEDILESPNDFKYNFGIRYSFDDAGEPVSWPAVWVLGKAGKVEIFDCPREIESIVEVAGCFL